MNLESLGMNRTIAALSTSLLCAVLLTCAPLAGSTPQASRATPNIVDSAGSVSRFFPKTSVLEKTNLPGVTTWQAPLFPVENNREYEASAELVCEDLVPGAAVSMHLYTLDQQGNVIGVVRDSARFQQVYAENLPQTLSLRVKTEENARFARMELKLAGNPLRIKILRYELAPYTEAPLFGGIYDDPDPMPDRDEVLRALASVEPTECSVSNETGSPVLVLDGVPVPYKAYRGSYDYRLMGENGANLIITHDHGSSLYMSRPWDEKASVGNGQFDFQRVEDNLLRIHAANPNLRVVLRVGCNPDVDWLEEHPESILLNEKGERGISQGGAFKGFGGEIDADQQEFWAWTYASEEYQQYVIEGLTALADFLKKSPAGKIVAGFSLEGGHDGQFVQWMYGDPEAGHADYSESFQVALRAWLSEKYGTDAALQEAWSDPNVTLKNARVFSGEEWRSRQYYNTDKGLDRKIVDCRTFHSISTARMLRRFGQTLKDGMGRPCVIQTWYSSPIWRQVTRLALSELAKGGVDIVAQVTDYAPPRLQRAPGGTANFSIAAAKLRGLLFVQELDHRTWRAQEIGGWNYTAYPKDVAEFKAQIMRDVGATLASGANGFYYYDMFGSWYHDPEAMEIVRQTFRMADWAAARRDNVPQPELAVFMDEPDRLHWEGAENGGSAMKSLRMSGLTPDVYMLDDILNPDLPEYKLYLFFSPVTITPEQIAAIKQKACRRGAVVMIIGPAGVCGPLKAAKPALSEFGLQVEDVLSPPAGEVVAFAEDAKHPLLKECRGRLGSLGVRIQDDAVSFLLTPIWTQIRDPDAVVLGYWLGTSEPGLVCKASKDFTLIYSPQIAGVSAQLLYNAARLAGIQPCAEPGNAVYVGRGVAAGHRLGDPVRLKFPCKMNFFDPDGKSLGSSNSFRMDCKPGECQVVLYERAN